VEGYVKVTAEVIQWHRFVNEIKIKPNGALDALLIRNSIVLPVSSSEAEIIFS